MWFVVLSSHDMRRVRWTWPAKSEWVVRGEPEDDNYRKSFLRAGWSISWGAASRAIFPNRRP